MTDPLTFPSTTNQFGLPLLFTGQAQKEFSINQALATIDAILPRAIEDSLSEAPSTPSEGQCYRITQPATGEWAQREDQLAVRIADDWHFMVPQDGMEIYDRAATQRLIYKSEWISSTQPIEPQGGAVIDVEARETLSDLLEVLRDFGLFAESQG